MNYKTMENEFNSSIPHHPTIPWFCLPPNFARVLFSISLRTHNWPFMNVLGVNRAYYMGWCGSGQYHFRFKRLPYWWNYKARYCCCTCYSTSTVSPLIFGSSEKGTSGTLHFSNSNTKSWKKETKTKWIRARFVKLAFTFSADNLRCSVRVRCTLSILVNSLLITTSHPRYFTYRGTPLRMLTSDTRETKQQLPQSLFCKQNSSHLDFFCVGILLNFLVH